MVVIMPTVTLRPVQTLRIILLHPWKNVNNRATFSFEQSFVRFLSRHIKLSYCYIYIYIYDFTDRGEFSNSRSYGEILEPLVIESETRNLLLSMFQSIFFSRYRVKKLSVNK